MDEASFRRILTTFADSPADINLQKGELLVQVRDDLIEASVFRREGSIFVVDNGLEYTALRWLVERVARLQLLAERLLNYVDYEPYFVTPAAEVVDELEHNAADVATSSPDALASLDQLLTRDRVGTAAVVYLVSDAGEGKTTVINALARRQATLYKQKQASWLLLPVALGGRPFLRFDDVVAAALLNRFRFPLFFDSFVELVRLGTIVPALDGFEEMFVESAAGDAASALGNLMSMLESSGTVLVAARQAYFDYKNLDTQARLYDALSGQSVSFSSVRLQRWSGWQFIDYSHKRGLPSAEHSYAKLSTHLGAEHPLLTRAVLASRIVELALEAGTIDAVTEQLDAGATDYFGELVRPILNREALKWVDKSGEPYQPLLSPDEHCGLLETLALEMWTGETAVVPAEILEWAAELFCSSRKKSAVTTRQVLERIKQHALLVNKVGSARGAFQFDHEEFYHYFLGRAIRSLLSSDDETTAKASIRRTSLPQLAVDTAAIGLRSDAASLDRAIKRVNRICRTEPAASFVRENAGAILIKSLHEMTDGRRALEGLSFPKDALRGRVMSNISFVNCDFAETEIDEGALRAVQFQACRFDVLFIRSANALADVTMTDCQVRAVAAPGSSAPTYDPKEIEDVLSALTARDEAVRIPSEQLVTIEFDEPLRHTDRVLRRFLRATEINENVVRQATGQYANQFFRDVLPELERHGIIREVSYLGSGQQRRFRLGRPLQQLSEALKKSAGDYSRFLELTSTMSR
jgi:hypothetical protein